MMAAMSLQQEDALNRLRMDTSFTFHLKQEGPGAILKGLFQAGQDWSNKIHKGEKLGPLRLVVFGLLLTETEARMHQPLDVPAMTPPLKQLSKMNFVNAGNSCYLNSTIFALLWQVHQRVDVVVPRRGKRY